MNTLTLTFLAPTSPLSENKARGAHWSGVRKSLDPWKHTAMVLARNAIVRGEWGGWKATAPAGFAVPITVHVTIPFREARRRDAHNYTGTVVKAIVDGLVRAGIVPDDTPEWVTVLDSTLYVAGPLPAPMTVTITIQERTP